MAGVLGIDAAWTEKEPSGVVLLEGSPGKWRCLAIAPSYDSFLTFAEGRPVYWSIKSRGAIPDVGRQLAAVQVKSWSFCNFLQDGLSLYLSRSIPPWLSRSSERRCSRNSSMSR